MPDWGYFAIALLYCVFREYQISKERSKLLDRIQAPQAAVIAAMPEVPPSYIPNDELEYDAEQKFLKELKESGYPLAEGGE